MSATSKPIERYLLLYFPWALAAVFSDETIVSYFIAWLGSFFIFYVIYSGWIKPLPNDRPVAEQLMRPIFLVQIIFIGYMACSSIFYFLDLLGVNQAQESKLFFHVDTAKLALAAQCQRYYVLGHAAFATGILVTMKYPIEKKFKVDNSKLANTLMVMAVIFLPVASLALHINGLSQFAGQFNSLSFIAGTLALAFAIPLKKVFNTLFCLFLYFVNFYQALTSGFKEPIIISVLVLGIFLYPSYKKAVTFTFIPALLALFMLLPTYNIVFRSTAWSGNADSEQAYKIALDATLNADNGVIDETTSGFLVYRLSEINMFTTFVQSTPKYIDFYGLELIGQSIEVIVPRIFWPSKPVTELLVMERVYNAGVAYRGSNVSAKPAYIVDGYLSAGNLGIVLALFIYGAAAQLISQKAEQLFGGYILGTALVFTGLFQIFWRGLSFEFLLNSVFWSYITMIILHRILKSRHILEEV
ncbi:exosortase Y-associated Wzy-like protein [Mucilaginibacter antarcticus]|uniref:Exosortase Y-associated Wzy-like protein n=1 Tax=Mucilaginibacter antarcticus TaxID=1855725 RepID=A0ABW5XL18_9SPHI